ncbi:c-type cytochrome [Usitatibacter palustris]|uniref:c-type cytochrome n=1 Tax=Usitatibacter palustris TaxID=2732487 RepID=UPI001FE4CBB2|nr:c-type cytochrome [Usitatibacter palustris]
MGRPATPAEITAWDIDVRPDFKGLPAGSGSVAKGQVVWESKCASCHGTFGESNEWFAPIVGGTTAEDVKAGRVKTLVTGDVSRTTLMKLSTISTLWDYINRAMPWTAPKSLTTEEVYAVVAYILNLGDILPSDFVLSNENIAQVQEKLPNRKGMRRDHGLWNVKGPGDVRNVACMKDCPVSSGPASSLPEHARDAHGNLAEQNRPVGGVRGAETTGKPALPKVASVVVGPADLAKSKACTACHNAENRVIGPSWKEIGAKYKGEVGAEAKLIAKIKAGGSGVWGPVPMPANPDLADTDAQALVRWILGK